MLHRWPLKHDLCPCDSAAKGLADRRPRRSRCKRIRSEGLPGAHERSHPEALEVVVNCSLGRVSWRAERAQQLKVPLPAAASPPELCLRATGRAGV